MSSVQIDPFAQLTARGVDDEIVYVRPSFVVAVSAQISNNAAINETYRRPYRVIYLVGGHTFEIADTPENLRKLGF